MRMLDENAPYGEIINDPRGARYEQFGCYFNGSKCEVDPVTGQVLGMDEPESMPEMPAMELPDAGVAPEPEAPAEPEPLPVAAGPVPDEIEGLDLTEINLDEAHWTHLRQYLKAFGQEYEGTGQALEYLSTIQKMQRG